MRLTIKKIKKYTADRRVNNSGTGTSTADVNEKAENPGISTSLSIADEDKRTDD